MNEPDMLLGSVLAPALVHLRLLRTCNATCGYCPSWRMAKTLPDFDFVSRCVEELGQVGTQEIRLTGGEVGLYPQLFELLELANRCGLRVSMITNGTVLVGALMKRLVTSSVARVLVSLDAPEAAIHDRIRGISGLFSKCERGLRELHGRRPDVVLEVNQVVSRQSVDRVRDAVEMYAEWGVDLLTLIPVKGCPDELPSREQMRSYVAAIPEIQARARELGIKLGPYDLDIFGIDEGSIDASAQGLYPLRTICHVPRREAFIDLVTGDVWPCNSTPYEDRKARSCGNLRGQSFAEVWGGQRFERIRRALSSGRPIPCSRSCDPSNRCSSEKYARSGIEMPGPGDA